MSTQEIPKGNWNSKIKVQYYFKNKYKRTITKNEALEKINQALKNGFRVVTGINPFGINYLLVQEARS